MGGFWFRGFWVAVGLFLRGVLAAETGRTAVRPYGVFRRGGLCGRGVGVWGCGPLWGVGWGVVFGALVFGVADL